MRVLHDRGDSERTRRLTAAALLVIAQLFTALGLAGSLAQIGPGTPICHVETTADHSSAPDQAPGTDCTLCPACLALHAVGLVQAPVPLRSPTLLHLAASSPVPAHAPPARLPRRANTPTGPPHLA